MTSKEVQKAQRQILSAKDTLIGVRIIRDTLKRLEEGARESGREEILDNICDYLHEPDYNEGYD